MVASLSEYLYYNTCTGNGCTGTCYLYQVHIMNKCENATDGGSVSWKYVKNGVSIRQYMYSQPDCTGSYNDGNMITDITSSTSECHIQGYHKFEYSTELNVNGYKKVYYSDKVCGQKTWETYMAYYPCVPYNGGGGAISMDFQPNSDNTKAYKSFYTDNACQTLSTVSTPQEHKLGTCVDNYYYEESYMNIMNSSSTLKVGLLTLILLFVFILI